ncbi:MAG: xanthine dehydrogenase family protein molybdopterin-binding subunit [bacterium]|nr:xanthine dehydrogenase family protein molybdopterin-binding subunit [bacterium]
MATTPSPQDKVAWEPRDEMTVLNKDARRLDGPVKVTGRAVYPHDVRLPNMVYARLLVHPAPRSKLTRVDVEPARQVPGVVYAEVLKSGGEEVLYQGDDAVLAVVAAETPEAAEDGVRAVVVELEELWPPMVTPEQALADDSPKITENGNVVVAGTRGDQAEVEATLGRCDAVVEASYSLPVQHHACLETHGCVVDFDGEKATTYPSTQMVTGSTGMFARELGISRSDVRVLTPYMGGGFGAKFGIGKEGAVASEVAKALMRPVHLMLTRPQEFLMAGNRSGSKQVMKGGATKDGVFQALYVEADKHGGMGRGSLPTPPYIYDVASNASTIRQVHTATDANRAMRAPGHPQASFAMESMVDELSYAIGMDPVEFRKKNLSSEVYHRQLDRVAKEIGWAEHEHRTEPGKVDGNVRVGIGFGVSTWGSGGRPGCKCEVRIEADGSIRSSVGTQDLGTGSRTYVASIVAEEFGLELSQVEARIGDSDLPPSVGSGGSVTTGSLAPAVKDAAHNARVALCDKVAPVLECDPDELTWQGGKVYPTGEPDRALTWKEACATVGSDPLVAMGEFQPHLHQGRVHGAQAAKISVDTLTGEIKVLKMVTIQDQGIPLIRSALRSQINGGMVQALSYGLLEQRVHDADLGYMLTANLEDYKIAGVQEIPEMVAIIDDDDTRQTVCGMAEATCIPGHAAIANALYNACGVRIRDLPLSADRVVTELAKRI